MSSKVFSNPDDSVILWTDEKQMRAGSETWLLLVPTPSSCLWAMSKLGSFTPTCCVHLDQRSNGLWVENSPAKVRNNSGSNLSSSGATNGLLGVNGGAAAALVAPAVDLSTPALTFTDNSPYLCSHLSPCLC